MEVILVRHGEVSADFRGQFYGGSEVPLSAHGQHQARLAGEFLAGLPIDAIYASPLGRARYGAEQLASRQKNSEITVLDGFREIDRGRWLGHSKSEVLATWPEDLPSHAQDLARWRGHGGESLGDLRDRVLSEWQHCAASQAPDSILALVSHLFPTRAIVAHAMGLELDQWQQLDIATGSVSWLTSNGDTWQVKSIGHQPDGRTFSQLYPQAFPQSGK